MGCRVFILIRFPIVIASLLLVACSSSDEEAAKLDSPGDACDGTAPLVCGSLAKNSTTSRKDVILFCNNGVYETVLNCAPTGNGLTNRCFTGGNSSVADCFDEPEKGKVTRCEVSGSGTSVVNKCTVGQMR
jgi:hypothetical protein